MLLLVTLSMQQCNVVLILYVFIILLCFLYQITVVQDHAFVVQIKQVRNCVPVEPPTAVLFDIYGVDIELAGVNQLFRPSNAWPFNMATKHLDQDLYAIRAYTNFKCCITPRMNMNLFYSNKYFILLFLKLVYITWKLNLYFV